VNFDKTQKAFAFVAVFLYLPCTQVFAKGIQDREEFAR